MKQKSTRSAAAAAGSASPGGNVIDAAHAGQGSAPELRSFHDNMFDATSSALNDLYGSPDTWPLIKRTGHFRRMEVLESVRLPDIEDAVAVDFGTGPWGFGCIFPALRRAKRCIGMDVSLTALEMAAARDTDIADKTTYMTSDGETIPLDDDTVDIFWGGEVIEHVRNPRRFLQEVARVCRDKARVMLSTPNKSPFFYAAHAEEYSTGPEHIALMDLEELKAVTSLFLDPVSIIGYETSLYPSIDGAIADEDAAARIQDRAYANPGDASGFIVDGLVKKSLLKRNRRDWRLEERLWSDAHIEGGASLTEAPLFSGVVGGALPPDQTIETAIQGDEIVLLFWAHDWSGVVEIEVDGIVQLHDLFSPGGGFRRIEFLGLRSGVHKIKIRRTGEKRLKSHDSQAILYKIMAYSS